MAVHRRRKTLGAEATRRGLEGVRFEPYQPEELLSQSLSAANVHLASLRPEFEGLIVPSKFHGIAADGRPCLFIGDGSGDEGCRRVSQDEPFDTGFWQEEAAH